MASYKNFMVIWEDSNSKISLDARFDAPARQSACVIPAQTHAPWRVESKLEKEMWGSVQHGCSGCAAGRPSHRKLAQAPPSSGVVHETALASGSTRVRGRPALVACFATLVSGSTMPAVRGVR